MKTKLKLSIAVLFCALLFTDISYAQQRGGSNGVSPDAAVSQTIFNKSTVSVTYGRPGLKGREISTLVPEGEIWRAGANEATTITFTTDVKFGGKDVPAGTYVLFILSGETPVFILNKDLTRPDGSPTWGAYTYKEESDLLRVSASSTSFEAPFMERFMIYFENLTDTSTDLVLHWGNVKTAVTVSID